MMTIKGFFQCRRGPPGSTQQRLSQRRSIVYTIIAFVFISLPQWVQAVWGLFSNEPLIPWLRSKGVAMPSFSLLWITWPIGLLLLALILWNIVKQNRKHQEVVVQPLEQPEPVVRPLT